MNWLARGSSSSGRISAASRSGVRHAYHWVAVNGGVLLVAKVVTVAEEMSSEATNSAALSALCCTLVLYLLVFASCALNLRGRSAIHNRGRSMARPIALRSIMAHPVGSAFERYVHGVCAMGVATGPMLASVLSNASAAVASDARTGVLYALQGSRWSWPIATACLDSTWWWLQLSARLLLFEIAFDGFFYLAHRAVHANPAVYSAVHKLHHAHTHDVRLLSSLQMTAADVMLTHTLPVLGALALVPLTPGLELSLAKTYLLFQELYGHAGVEHRGRCFGPAPFLVSALGIDLHAEDHRRHHIQASVNFSKRFSLWDKLAGTWYAENAAKHN